MEPTIEQIRAMITANHGGLSHCTDEEMRRIWANLSPEVREAYLNSDEATKRRSDEGKKRQEGKG